MLLLFTTEMAVEIPNAAIRHILDRQVSWEEQTHIKSSVEYYSKEKFEKNNSTFSHYTFFSTKFKT